MEVVVGLAAAVMSAVAALFLVRAVVGYRVGRDAIEFLLFHVLPIYRVPFTKIKIIRKASWPEVLLRLPTILFLTNWIFVRSFVMIEKRSGFSRRIVITPPDPNKFLREACAAGGRLEPPRSGG